MSAPLLSVRDLEVHYSLPGGLFGARPVLRAAGGVSLDITECSSFGLVGESGSGKTTFGRALLRAAPVYAGQVSYDDGEARYDVGSLDAPTLRPIAAAPSTSSRTPMPRSRRARRCATSSLSRSRL